jgi:hypothetical protein
MGEADKKKTKHDAFDKRLRRIERWLRRCAEACRCGALGAAIMEIECMEAETREFRKELWEKAEDEAAPARPRSLKKAVFACVRVTFLSAALVLAAGLPLSVEQDRPFHGFQPESLALLTSTESDILNALRESLSSRNSGTIVLSIELPEEAGEPAPPNFGAAAAETTAPARAPAVKVLETKPPAPETSIMTPEPVETQATPTVEEVLSLIQVGQMALRVSEPAVKILPAQANQGNQGKR